MTMYGERTPSVGTLVLTMDGDELGKVKEISGACFKIDAPMAPDYWLGDDLVYDATDGIMRLTISKDMLREAKLESPDHTGYHRHN